jgi:transcriptional regulator with XRE-family HTH domain
VSTQDTAAFGKELRRLRRAAGISLVEFASALGISKSYLSDIERGLRNPFHEQLVKSAAAILAARDRGGTPWNAVYASLCRCAARSRGFYRLGTLSELHAEAADALIEAWPELSPKQLRNVIEAVRKEEA